MQPDTASACLAGGCLLTLDWSCFLPNSNNNGCEMSAWEGTAGPQLPSPPARGVVPGRAVLTVLQAIPLLSIGVIVSTDPQITASTNHFIS